METSMFADQVAETWSQTVTMPKRFAQAYRQAPWRIQTQRGVLLLIVAILGASMLWVMVSVTVQASSAGLEIQQLEDVREDVQRQIAGQRTLIGIQTSKAQMEKRATEMNFEPINPADLTYIVIPGFKGREPVIGASPPRQAMEQPLIKPAYTQSLWEWLLQGILEMNQQQGGSVR